MSTTNRQHKDMSIEKILKSIKNVINDHNGFKIDNNDTDDILELTEVVDQQLDSQHATTDEIDEHLISPESAVETSNILKNFANTIQDKDFNNVTASKNALEELVIELLKPELKKWLNENLPSLVKDLVDQELKRLIPNKNKE